MHEDAKHVMSARKGPPSNLTTSSGAGSTIDPFDERLFNFMGRPKEATAEEKALAMEEKQLDLKRKNWQLEKDQEEWESLKKNITPKSVVKNVTAHLSCCWLFYGKEY